jgi:hypothetical protein
MNSFIKGIYFDQLNRVDKMLSKLKGPGVSKEIDAFFLNKTIELMDDLRSEIQQLINSGDLEVEALASNNIIKYNTFDETLMAIELFRYLVIVNYGEAEEYFKRKVKRIYDEINCLQRPPIITTISNSDDYYWALPSYDIIAVPTGEEKNLLNLPDMFHEMGHLIYNQYQTYLKGTIEQTLAAYYKKESQRVINEQRSPHLIQFFRDNFADWKASWIMEFCCDLIATYLVGPAFAWTNLKITTQSSGQNGIYIGSSNHPSDEARMRAVFYMLKKMGHTEELKKLEEVWRKFLDATNNIIPANYSSICPQHIVEELANNVYNGSKLIDLRIYGDQVKEYTNPISKIINEAWEKVLLNPGEFKAWEDHAITKLEESLKSAT